MKRVLVQAMVATALTFSAGGAAGADQPACDRGAAEANIERLVLDDMQDIAGWYNGSPVETTLARSERAKEGRYSLAFANVVDHFQGEKDHPVGWPRVGRDLAKTKRTDWSDYDFFECWIYTETSRAQLPATPVSIGFSHTGPKRATSVTLKEVKKDEWVKIVVPIARLLDAQDVRRVQFNISEANYKHGDRVTFFINRPALTRYIRPVIAQVDMDRRLHYANDRHIVVSYTLLGRQGMDQVKLQLEIGPAQGACIAQATGPATRQGDLALSPGKALDPGTYWARLSVRDRDGKQVDCREVEFRVIAGPF
jgi:hypothetical protein